MKDVEARIQDILEAYEQMLARLKAVYFAQQAQPQSQPTADEASGKNLS